jgi:hypothetical protein
MLGVEFVTKGSATLTTRCRKDFTKLRVDLKNNAAKTPALRRKDLVAEQGYDYELDSAGRTVKATGKLKLKKAKRSGHFQRKAGGKFRICGMPRGIETI